MQAEHDAVLDLLRQRNAASILHPGGTLLEHLQRVERRLHRHGSDAVLRLAALAHAVYGTDGFDTCLLTLNERNLLVEAADDDVEQLVYLYAACDRRKTWRHLYEEREIHDRWTGAVVHPTQVMLARFVDLSTINELDVIEQSTQARAMNAAQLLDIFRTWRGIGTPAISADAEQVLSNVEPHVAIG